MTSGDPDQGRERGQVARRPTSDERLGWPLWCLVSAALTLVACLLHAEHTRTERAEYRDTAILAVRVLGAPDLALSSTSRWLRHPSQAEPAAAAQDGPAWLDTDPAGGLITPPTALYEAAVGEAAQPATERTR